MTTAHIRWALGGEATVLAVSADTIALESTTPSPPGSRIDGVLVAGSGRGVRVKVHSSKLQQPGRFRIDGRPIDFTKDAREELLALIAAPAPTTGE